MHSPTTSPPPGGTTGAGARGERRGTGRPRPSFGASGSAGDAGRLGSVPAGGDTSRRPVWPLGRTSGPGRWVR
ncbi:hypothetical protein AB0A05_34470 [Streptomyces sp. NPDC046374]|uniref:hypothetical protein n=1 Tax=Streptomyces sp. NPDC046374 TaxID=3154917 RepID=UPI0033C2B67D